MQLTVGIILLLISAVISLAISVYFVLYGRRTSLLNSFVFFQILVFIWCLGNVFDITANDIKTKWIAVCFENFSICFVGFAWLLFSLLFTGSRIPKKGKNLVFLSAGPFAFYLLTLINNSHHKYYSIFELNRVEFGLLFWLHCMLSYLYLLAGMLIILQFSIKHNGVERKQATLFVVAMSIPLISNVLQLSGTVKLDYDITPISFSLSLLLFALATFRYRFLNVIPAALRKVFDTVNEAIVFIDNEGLIIDSNTAFLETFSDFGSGNSIGDFLLYLKNRIDVSTDTEAVLNTIQTEMEWPMSKEISLDKPEKSVFRVSVQPVKSKSDKLVGRVISFVDITQYRSLVDELSEANHKLKLHAMTVEELAVVKERNRVARDMHDNLGHSLTLLTKIQEAALASCGTDNEKTLEAIKRANEVTRQGLKELRLSIYNIMPERTEASTLLEELGRLSSGFKSLGIDIQVSVDGNTSYINPVHSEVILRICREAVTNSIKHGKADEIHIMLRFSEDRIKLFIIDNGTGCTKINKGCGLSGMEERLDKLGGNIVFGSDGESGFNIHIEIPLEG